MRARTVESPAVVPPYNSHLTRRSNGSPQGASFAVRFDIVSPQSAHRNPATPQSPLPFSDQSVTRLRRVRRALGAALRMTPSSLATSV